MPVVILRMLRKSRLALRARLGYMSRLDRTDARILLAQCDAPRATGDSLRRFSVWDADDLYRSRQDSVTGAPRALGGTARRIAGARGNPALS